MTLRPHFAAAVLGLLLATGTGTAAFAAAGDTVIPGQDTGIEVTIPTSTPTPTPTTSPVGTKPVVTKPTGTKAATPPAVAPATEPTIPTTPGSGGTLVIDAEMFEAGDTVTVTGTGFAPGEQVQVVLFSEPLLIGNFTVDPAGELSTSFALSDTLLPGTHTVQYTGWSSKKIATVEFVVTSATSVAAVAPIPTIVWWIAGGAVGLLAAGAAVFFAVRAMREGGGRAPVTT